jgi:hypothetical protein
MADHEQVIRTNLLGTLYGSYSCLQARRRGTEQLDPSPPTSMDTPFFEHAGNYTGHQVEPIPPSYDPENVIEVNRPPRH